MLHAQPLGADLADIMVEVAMVEYAPRWPTRRSKERVLRPCAARSPGDESPNQGVKAYGAARFGT